MASSTGQHQILTASIPTRLFPIFFRNKLRPLLPYSLPLYRRCEYHLYDLSLKANTKDPSGEPGQPELWVAVAFPAQSCPHSTRDWLNDWLDTSQPATTTSTNDNIQITMNNEEQVWLANHIDLREPGQTQIWTFGSWEPELTPMTTPSLSTTSTVTPTQIQTRLARAFFSHLRLHHIPTLPRTPSQQYLTMKAAGKVVSSPYKRSKILFGTIAETSWWMLEDDIVSDSDRKSQSQTELTSSTSNNKLTTNKAIARQDKPYLKYILHHPLPPSSSLPASIPNNDTNSNTHAFTTSPLQTQHLQTVLDRSPIPRTLELLRTLVTIGLFPAPTPNNPNPDPVAWGILSKDASIGSLHTEPEYRGKGLAELVVRALIKENEKSFRGSQSEADAKVEMERVRVGYSHTDVSAGNLASRRVFEKMGAVVGWRVGWVDVDVEFEDEE